MPSLNLDPRQSTMDQYFEVPRDHTPTAGSLNLDREIRALLNKAVKDSRLTRAEIAARMTDLIFGDDDGEITKAQLDSWTGPSRTDWRFPLAYLPAFMVATDDISIINILAEKIGCKVMVPEQLLDAALGRIKRRQDELRTEEKRLKKLMGRTP